MEQKKILVVDDEQDLCEILSYNLSSAGYQVQLAYSAEEALKKDLRAFHLLLLDVMMPGMSGFELAQIIKQDEQTAHIPIIFLTAKDTEQDMLTGFELGADDYVKKPFSIREVMARVNAVLSRTKHEEADNTRTLRYKGLSIDLGKKIVSIDGEEISLTRTEFDLLSLLLEHHGRVLSRQEMIDRVWPKDVVVTDRAVDVNITRLRKKIGDYHRCIVARQGFGYIFEA